MRLFNDMVSAILACDKPVICRVNGMRIGGGQEIGMACDFSIAQDLARFGQAGPKHGSAPIGGATDFLPPMIGIERAMVAGVLCEPFSAHKAYHWGILADIVPALKVDGKFVANPLVETQTRGRRVRPRSSTASFKTGDAREGRQGAARARRRSTSSLLDAKVEELCAKLLLTFPDCTTKTLEELRKPKLDAWNRNKENSRAWLALNMMTEARAGFRAFNEGTKETARSISCCCARRSPRARAGSVRCTTRFSRGPGARAETACRTRLPLKAWIDRDGALLRLRLARPKANLIDAAMIAALHGALRDIPRRTPDCAPCCSTPRVRTSASARASRSICPTAARRCSRRCTRSSSRCSNFRRRSWSPCAASASAAGSRSRSPAA